MGELTFPRPVTLSNICEFSNLVMNLPESEVQRVITGPSQFISPTGLICLPKILNQRRYLFHSERVEFFGIDGYGYANNLGFSDALGLEGRPFPQGAFGGSSYVPISRMLRDELEAEASSFFVPMGEVIDKKCVPIAERVSQGLSDELTNLIAHLLREIFRNVFEHSKADACGYCVQYWPNQKEVEFCIADRGIGIRNSLMENKYLGAMDHIDALKLAVMPGMSSKAWRYKKKKSSQKSDWDNAGIGLFQAYKLFGSLGHLMVASGPSALIFSKGQAPRVLSCNFEGTVVSARANLKFPEKVGEIVDGIISEASEVKARIGTKSVDIRSVTKYLNISED